MWVLLCPEPTSGCPLTRTPPQIPYSNQVVNGRGEFEDPVDALLTAMSALAHQSHGLHPPKELLDQLAFGLANLIADMPRGSTINRTAPMRIILRDMWRDA